MTNIKNNLEKEVNRISSEWIKILYGEDEEVEINELKKQLKNSNWQPLNLKPNEKSYEYYKGFYDATHQFMQTFEKLIEAGAFSGTKFNSNN